MTPNPGQSIFCEDEINSNNELRKCLNDCIQNIPQSELNDFAKTEIGKFYKNERSERFNKEFLFRQIDLEIVRSRIDCIYKGNDLLILANYFPTLDSEGLVSLSEFQHQFFRLEKNGQVFHMAPSLPQVNSSYWVSHILTTKYLSVAKIRIDPFWILPSAGYRQMMYRVNIYGPDFDWNRILSLRNEEHNQFMPEQDSSAAYETYYTEVVWSPRGNEIHFIAEEIPTTAVCSLRGGRYMHSIFDKNREAFVHIDGAIRYYSAEELNIRKDIHVRNAGKIGKRIKLFRIDADVPLQDWKALLGSFYIWNNDIANYAPS
ncbi:MAG: hypothetical protein ACHQM6_00730 [Candidatus Kapaibacterium sp.]